MLPWGLIIIFVIGGYIWGVQYKHDNMGTNVIYPNFVSFEADQIPQNTQQKIAWGGYTPKTSDTKYGEIIPQNKPQGYSPSIKTGREGMLPFNYMVPDNFNRPYPTNNLDL